MKMSEDDLLRWLETEQQAAYQYRSSEVAQFRADAMKQYLREPYGTETEGRSSVVASDVFDAIEGMLPDILEPFVASDKAVVFDPVGPEDEQGAEQATNACNHVFYKQNNGFVTLYSAAKDALMLRCGGVKWYWEVKRTPEWTTYRAVDEMQIAAFLATNPKAQIVSREDYEPEPQEVQQAQQQGIELPQRFTIKVKTVKERGQVRVVPIPPDELEISPRHNSPMIADCPYVAHVCERTLSDIREMGYDVDLDDVKASQNDDSQVDRDFRQQFQGGAWGWWREDNDVEPSMVRGWLREEYILVDFDGDGIAERRKVVRLGDKILENVEFSHVPIAAWTPYILTHRFEGLSVTDLVEDFQRIRTDIWRAQIDNLALANNQETVVLTDAQGNPQANIDDLLNRRPGGIMRERTPGAIRPYVERWQGIEAMPMIELLENAKENRTGYTRYSQGLDGESLNQTATGITKVMNASQKRMKIMARIMAEALVAPMFRGIFKTLTDYCMEKLSFRLNNNFVQYDPQEWRDGYDMSINVGIGQGDQIQQGMFLQGLWQSQMMLLQTPFAQMVQPQNVFNLQARMIELAGFKTPTEFVTDPKTIPPQPPQQPPPDPQIVKTQMQIQADAQKFTAQLQNDAQKFQAETQMQMQIDQNRQEYEARQKQMELEQMAQLEALKAQFAAQANAEKLALEKYKADLDAQVKMAISEKSSPDTAGIEGALQELQAHLQAPAEIIRDASGMAIGIKKGATTKRLQRDEQGRAMGIE